MRYLSITFLAISAAMLPLACNNSPTSTLSNAREKIEDAADATAAAARLKRDEFARDLQVKLDEFDAKCAVLEQRAAEAKGEAKKDLEAKLTSLKPKRDAAARKLGELKEAGHDRWEKVKDSARNAFDDLKKGFE